MVTACAGSSQATTRLCTRPFTLLHRSNVEFLNFLLACRRCILGLLFVLYALLITVTVHASGATDVLWLNTVSRKGCYNNTDHTIVFYAREWTLLFCLEKKRYLSVII